MPVRVERRGRVLTVIHSRPEARNAAWRPQMAHRFAYGSHAAKPV